MRKSITVNIPEPCHEDWNKMTTKDKGRHCSACSKTVVDFTNKTDEEIIRAYETIGNLCGRFKNQQLNREIVLTRKNKNNILSIAASGILAFLAVGCQKNTPLITSSETLLTDYANTPMIKEKKEHTVLNNKVVSGVVMSKDLKLPLSGVAINVKGTSKKTTTDIKGEFKIEVEKREVLIFSHIDFKTKIVVVDEMNKILVKMKSQNTRHHRTMGVPRIIQN